MTELEEAREAIAKRLFDRVQLSFGNIMGTEYGPAPEWEEAKKLPNAAKFWFDQADAILNLRYKSGKKRIGVLAEDQTAPVCPDNISESFRNGFEMAVTKFSRGFKRIVGDSDATTTD